MPKTRETSKSIDREVDERHAFKMAKKKAARDKILATKTIKKGLLGKVRESPLQQWAWL